jgi:L-cystine uptake protein TcyP (sodium:dicarboxylate symporter family)
LSFAATGVDDPSVGWLSLAAAAGVAEVMTTPRIAWRTLPVDGFVAQLSIVVVPAIEVSTVEVE